MRSTESKGGAGSAGSAGSASDAPLWVDPFHQSIMDAEEAHAMFSVSPPRSLFPTTFEGGCAPCVAWPVVGWRFVFFARTHCRLPWTRPARCLLGPPFAGCDSALHSCRLCNSLTKESMDLDTLLSGRLDCQPIDVFSRMLSNLVRPLNFLPSWLPSCSVRGRVAGSAACCRVARFRRLA